MGEIQPPSKRAPQGDAEAAEFQLVFDGGVAARGEIVAGELAAALQGWERLLELSFYSYHTASLELPPVGTGFGVEMRIRRVRRGSVIIDVVLWFGDHAAGGLISTGVVLAGIKAWPWVAGLVRAHLDSKAHRGTEDAAIEDIERLANEYLIRVSRNRQDSERFVSAVNSSLGDATAPLDGSAERATLLPSNGEIRISLDRADRRIITAPFEPPALEDDDASIIEAPIRFIRINKQTGYGLFQFVRPAGESQVATQRFRCTDARMRQRANPYTGAFHEDAALVVRMQQKGYTPGRRGHYWLITLPVQPPDRGKSLFEGT